jgi:ABC-type multidrug transport system ATPase subunit
MIELVGVTQHYGVRPVLQDISLTIDTGGVTAIVGPNGMGKTTLLGVMAGLLSPQRGEVRINKLQRRGSVEEELEIRHQVAYLPDQPWLPKNRTGREFLFGVGKLYDIDDIQLFDHVERLLALFQLDREGDWPIRSYSHGQKKKIALAAVLITDCPILLLDEPFGGGLDPSGILALKEVLKRLAKKPQRMIIMTAPDPSLVEELAERILVLRDGRIAAFDTADGLRRLAGEAGALTDVIGRLTFPEALDAVDRYFDPKTS